MWTVHWKERKIIMINFDEEIQKFQPSLEVEDAQILSGKNTDK